MKKILASLLVLALCAPAMAATIDVVGGTDGTAVVTITADGAANIVGLGLDVDVDGGAQVTAVSIDTPDFNIYPDAAYTLELGAGYNYGDGTPVAAKTVAGQIALPQSSFALSFANLNGEAEAGADGAASVQITITVDAACTLTVCENATRGGIVAVDGTALEAACDADAITIGPGECVKSTAPFYADWVNLGKPDCWCYIRQCRGDVDGASVFGKPVLTADLTLFKAAYNKALVDLPTDGECADLDHTAVFGKRVLTSDLTIFKNYYNKALLDVPECDDTNYNFWITP